MNFAFNLNNYIYVYFMLDKVYIPTAAIWNYGTDGIYEDNSHSWLDVCKFQRKQLLPPTEYHQRHTVQRILERPMKT